MTRDSRQLNNQQMGENSGQVNEAAPQVAVGSHRAESLAIGNVIEERGPEISYRSRLHQRLIRRTGSPALMFEWDADEE